MKAVLGFGILVCVLLGVARPAEARDQQADLEALLAPIGAWRQRTEDALRPVAGSQAADAALIGARLELKEIVAEIAVPLQTPEFQRLLWPDGAAGQAHRRAAAAEKSAPASEAVSADALVEYLRDRGVWTERAEGDTYFYVNDSALLDWFGPLVTGEIRTFLHVWADERTTPVAEDASIQVPLDELERRIVATGRFLADYPTSLVRDPVRVRHGHYIWLYLGGTDNTPAFDTPSGLLRPDLLRRFEAFCGRARRGRRPDSRAVPQAPLRGGLQADAGDLRVPLQHPWGTSGLALVELLMRRIP